MNSTLDPSWGRVLGLSESVPSWVIATIGLICTFVFVVLPSGALISYLDRKLGADLQARVGPNRAGPRGLGQPLADIIKLLQKEGIQLWTWREILWLGVHTMALYSTVAVLPLGSSTLLVDTDMSAFLPFFSALVLALGTMLLGFSQGSVPGWFGGARVASQALSGAFPAITALLCAGMHAGSFRWSFLAGVQSASPIHWTLFADPFQPLAFFVFVASGLILLGIPPLDGGLSLPDLHGGVSSHLYGRGLGLFRLGRFYCFFLWCVIAAVLFLGAWVLPHSLTVALKEAEAWKILMVAELSWLLLKAFGLMLLVVWLARTNPRCRVDHITDFSWKILSPFALFALVGSSLWLAWRQL